MKKILPIILVAIIVGGGVFFAGYKIGQNSNSFFGRMNGVPDFIGSGNGQGLQGGSGFGARNGGMVSGEILSKDDSSITIKLRDGGSKIVFYSESTAVNKTIDGVISDLEIGKSVIVSGTTNDDGSVSAKTIQLQSVNIINSPQP